MDSTETLSDKASSCRDTFVFMRFCAWNAVSQLEAHIFVFWRVTLHDSFVQEIHLWYLFTWLISFSVTRSPRTPFLTLYYCWTLVHKQQRCYTVCVCVLWCETFLSSLWSTWRVGYWNVMVYYFPFFIFSCHSGFPHHCITQSLQDVIWNVANHSIFSAHFCQDEGGCSFQFTHVSDPFFKPFVRRQDYTDHYELHYKKLSEMCDVTANLSPSPAHLDPTAKTCRFIYLKVKREAQSLLSSDTDLLLLKLKKIYLLTGDKLFSTK